MNVRTSPEKSITLIVRESTLTAEVYITDQNEKRRFQVRAIELRNGNNTSLNYYGYDNRATKYLIETLSISVEFGLKKIKVKTPEKINERIINFLETELNGRSRNELFDCFSFACFINHIPHIPRKIHKFRDIDYGKGIEELQAGDTIIITKKIDKNSNELTKKDRLRHFAVYIGFFGEMIFVSKFGNSGQLIVTNLEEMLKGFDGDTVYKAQPKNTLSA